MLLIKSVYSRAIVPQKCVWNWSLKNNLPLKKDFKMNLKRNLDLQ